MATEEAMRDDLYGVFGLEPWASREQVESVYHFYVELYGDGSLATQSLLKPGEVVQHRARVREAYEVLGDPERRRAYDEGQGSSPPDAQALPALVHGSGASEPESFALSPSSLSALGDTATFASESSVAASVASPGLAALLAPGGAAFEPFRVLRTKLRALEAQRPARCLGLVSATAQEGTSTVALGLAAALAQERENRVLLVEARLRAPALERALGLDPQRGLADWLCGPPEQPVPVRRVEPWGFHLLVGGAPAPPSAERLGSESMGRLLAAARSQFDFVLLDCPPLEAVADSVMLQSLLDGFLLVVRARHASRTAIGQALAHLEPGAVRGVVFNDRTEILTRWLDRRAPRPTPSTP